MTPWMERHGWECDQEKRSRISWNSAPNSSREPLRIVKACEEGVVQGEMMIAALFRIEIAMRGLVFWSMAVWGILIVGCGNLENVSRLAPGQAVVVYQTQPLYGTGIQDVLVIPPDATKDDPFASVAVGTTTRVVDDNLSQSDADRWVTVSVLKYEVKKNRLTDVTSGSVDLSLPFV
ncbi:MAG: hypothetical protein KDB01_01365 [Planctomycetaceae bacterium]|nr:hypothetical protein [Planctomycetaceae bacterium]